MLQNIKVKNEISLITGSCGHLGKEFANSLAEIGYNLILTDKSKKDLVNLKKEIEKKFKNKVYIKACNLSSYKSREKLIRFIKIKTNKLNLSQATIILDGIKSSGLEDREKKYPAYDIQTAVLDDVQVHKLPDIYQSNLQLLDKDKFSRVFKTGKGFTMLHVLASNVLVEEYKVSHILMKTNPMEGPKEIKNQFYEIKTNVQNGDSFSNYAEEFSMDKVSAIKGGTLGWITKELVVENFRKVMMNTKVNLMRS